MYYLPIISTFGWLIVNVMKNRILLSLIAAGCLLASGAAAQNITALDGGQYRITVDDVTMTVSESTGNSSVEGFYEGENVYIAAESGTTVTASTSSGPVDVRTVSENRYVLTAPGTDFTVKFS